MVNQTLTPTACSALARTSLCVWSWSGSAGADCMDPRERHGNGGFVGAIASKRWPR